MSEVGEGGEQETEKTPEDAAFLVLKTAEGATAKNAASLHDTEKAGHGFSQSL